MQNFKDLKVWNEAHQITLELYKVTRDFPRDEQFGLTAQIRRASASIPANIAEGCGRASQKELSRFLHVAMGSANELQYHLLLAGDLAYLSADRHRYLDQRVIRVRRMLFRLNKKVRSTIRD